MRVNASERSFSGIEKKIVKDIESSRPQLMKYVSSFNVTKGGIGRNLIENTRYVSCDSLNGLSRLDASGSGPFVEKVISPELKAEICKRIDAKVKMGISEEKARKSVQDSMCQLMGYDASKRKVVLTYGLPDTEKKGLVKDSLLEAMRIPFYNISYYQKLFRQPYSDVKFRNLMSVETFGNAWADVIMFNKEIFEGAGKVSSVAKGNMKQNNSNPITSEVSADAEDVINISVEYVDDFIEKMKAQIAGNWITPQVMSHRARMASYFIELAQAGIMLYGDEETQTTGLVDVAGIEDYSGETLWEIYKSTTYSDRGSRIYNKMKSLISEFRSSCSYMPTEINIAVSTKVKEALDTPTYSDAFNPSTPTELLMNSLRASNELDGAIEDCKINIYVDRMCDPNTVWNPTNEDMMFITAPKIKDKFGEESGLIIAPELIKEFIVPVPYQDVQGTMHRMYRRIGGVYAPLENSVRVIRGFGYSG